MACPIHGGKHPFHDNRYITTADATVEHSPHVENDWMLERGELICEMRDGPNANAKLIAAAPELLAALNECADELFAAVERATGPENAANRYNLRKRAELARAAIAKATQ